MRPAKPNLRLLELPAIDTLRLSPLAFPRNQYHNPVKHYRDGGLERGRVNDPEFDSRAALKLFGDEREALAKAAPELLSAWHRLCTPEPEGADRGLDGFFREVRRARRPSPAEAAAAIGRQLDAAACVTAARSLAAGADEPGWPLAHALARLSVASGYSVMLQERKFWTGASRWDRVECFGSQRRKIWKLEVQSATWIR